MNFETFVIFQTSPFRVVTNAVLPTKSSEVGRSSSSTSTENEPFRLMRSSSPLSGAAVARRVALRERVERPVGTGFDVDEQAETGRNLVSIRPGGVRWERDDLPRRRDTRHRPCLGHEHRAVGHRQPRGDDVLELEPLRDFPRGRHVEHPVEVSVGDEEPAGGRLERANWTPLGTSNWVGGGWSMDQVPRSAKTVKAPDPSIR